MKRTHIAVALIGITVVVILVATIAGIIFGARWIGGVFDVLDPQTSIMLGLATCVVLLCAWMMTNAIRSAKQREIESRIATQCASLYDAVLESLDAFQRVSGPTRA